MIVIYFFITVILHNIFAVAEIIPVWLNYLEGLLKTY